MPVKAHPVIPVADDDIFPIYRIFSQILYRSFPNRVYWAPLGGGQIYPLMDAVYAGYRINPGPIGTGEPEMPQGKTKAPVEKENPLCGAQIRAGYKKKAFLVFGFSKVDENPFLAVPG
jgi:hypothetical protein